MFKILTVMMAAVLFSNVTLSAAEAAPAAEETKSNFGRTAMLYLPNLLGDLLDLVTFEFSVGATASADVHLTYFADLGFENSDAYFVGSNTGHRWGAGRREAQHIGFFCWSYDDMYISECSGSVPSFSMEDCSFNLVRYYTRAFRDNDIDLYAIGFRVSALLGVAVDLHLRELPDFFCQIVGYDLAGDNWK